MDHVARAKWTKQIETYILCQKDRVTHCVMEKLFYLYFLNVTQNSKPIALISESTRILDRDR